MMDGVISSFLGYLAAINPLQAKFARSFLKNLTDDEAQRMADCISYYDNIFGERTSVMSYDFICREMIREEIFFKKNKAQKYRINSYEEAKNSVYSNDEFMQKYMIGLGISTFVWPNHLSINRYFRKNLPKAKVGRYLEIGVGHGQNFADAVRICNFNMYIGYDISQVSLYLTEQAVKATNCEEANYKLVLGDFLSEEITDSFDAVICAEVIEHLERPDEMLGKIKELSNPDSHVYITTAINSPAPDHIHLFRSVDEVLDLFRASGFRVIDKLVLPPWGKSMPDAVSEKLSLNAAFILEKTPS